VILAVRSTRAFLFAKATVAFCHPTDAAQMHCHASLRVASDVGSDAFIAPGDMGIELAPLQLHSLQRQTRDGGQLVARVLEHVW
jgi:hypothetical protein